MVWFYLLASIIPAVAVTVRRLHDVNKNPFIYLGIGIFLPLFIFFIGYWTWFLVLVWGILLVRILSKETYLGSSPYGEPNKDDEVYGENSIRIIHKFRLLAVIFWGAIFVLAYTNFDNWAVQAQYRSTNNEIMEKVKQSGEQAGLSEDQINAVQQAMKQQLKAWNGKTIMPADISKAIEEGIQKEMKKQASDKK